MLVPSGNLSRLRHHRYCSRKQMDCVWKPGSESEVMRRDRSAGVDHRLLEKQRSCRWIVRVVIPANLSSTRGEAASGDGSAAFASVQRTLKPSCSYLNFQRRIVRLLIPKISAACHQVIFFAIARNITSCTFYGSLIPPAVSAACRPPACSFKPERVKSGQLVC